MRKSGRCSHTALCAPPCSAGSRRGAYVCRNANPLSQDPDSGRHQRSESFREKLNSFRALLSRMCPAQVSLLAARSPPGLTLSGPFLIDLGFERLHYFINSGDRPTAVLNVRGHSPCCVCQRHPHCVRAGLSTQNVSGQFLHKRLIAIMGPSGAGKTTLLRVRCLLPLVVCSTGYSSCMCARVCVCGRC